jgi:hypothetical protein
MRIENYYWVTTFLHRNTLVEFSKQCEEFSKALRYSKRTVKVNRFNEFFLIQLVKLIVCQYPIVYRTAISSDITTTFARFVLRFTTPEWNVYQRTVTTRKSEEWICSPLNPIFVTAER